MEKEFVPYELAVKLKELGFDEPCFGHFGSITEPEELQIFPNTESCLEPEDMINSNLDYGLSCTAPTFSQAFRWFRENYNLNYWVKEESQVRFSWRIYKGDGYATWDCHPLLSNTYEEAELACLEKLIEMTHPNK